MQSVPARNELVPVKLCPSKNEAFLTSWKRSRNEFDRFEPIDSDVLLIIRVKVGKVMTAAGLDEHPDHDSEEAREFRHQL